MPRRPPWTLWSTHFRACETRTRTYEVDGSAGEAGAVQVLCCLPRAQQQNAAQQHVSAPAAAAGAPVVPGGRQDARTGLPGGLLDELEPPSAGVGGGRTPSFHPTPAAQTSQLCHVVGPTYFIPYMTFRNLATLRHAAARAGQLAAGRGRRRSRLEPSSPVDDLIRYLLSVRSATKIGRRPRSTHRAGNR